MLSQKTGCLLRFTDERINHILQNHPELEGEEDKIAETIANPDTILEGDFGELLSTKHYLKSSVSENKYLIVAYEEISNVDGFIITAYYTRRLSKRRKVIWKP